MDPRIVRGPTGRRSPEGPLHRGWSEWGASLVCSRAAFPTFRTATYVTHAAEYLPRAMARLVVDVAALTTETDDRHPFEVLTLTLTSSGADKPKGSL